MAIDLWLLAAIAALNAAALLLWCCCRFRVVITAPRVVSMARSGIPPTRDTGETNRVGRGESRLAEDLERFRQRMQETPSC